MTAGVDAVELETLTRVHTLSTTALFFFLERLRLLSVAPWVLLHGEMFTVCMDDSTTGNNNTPFFPLFAFHL